MSVVSTVFGALESGDLKLMRRVHRWRAPRWIRIWMLCATRGRRRLDLVCDGSHRTGVRRRGEVPGVASATLSAAIGVALFLILKKRIGRRRPCALEPHCWSTLLPPDQFSFPSGHTITAFAVSVSLIAFYPGLAAGLLFCAGSIGLSRILLGMHFLTDVLAGAALGIMVALFSVHYVISLLFT